MLSAEDFTMTVDKFLSVEESSMFLVEDIKSGLMLESVIFVDSPTG